MWWEVEACNGRVQWKYEKKSEMEVKYSMEECSGNEVLMKLK